MRLVSRAWKLRFFCLLVLVSLAFFAVGWWYFSFYTKSPDYSVRMIDSAIKNYDTDNFKKYVDVERLVDSSADVVMYALVDAEPAISSAGKGAALEFTKYFKAPLLESLKVVMLTYVEKGELVGGDSGKEKITIDATAILNRLGIKDMSFKQVEALTMLDSGLSAEVGIRILLNEIGEEYVLNVVFEKDDNGVWRAAEILNLGDMIGFIRDKRREQVREYLAVSKVLMDEYDNSMKLAQIEQGEIIASGNLSMADTRRKLQKLYEETILTDWQKRQTELNKLEVPAAARYLHKLRLKICEVHIAHAELYIKWLNDKNGKTAREANEKLKQANTLEREMLLIMRRMSK